MFQQEVAERLVAQPQHQGLWLLERHGSAGDPTRDPLSDPSAGFSAPAQSSTPLWFEWNRKTRPSCPLPTIAVFKALVKSLLAHRPKEHLQ